MDAGRRHPGEGLGVQLQLVVDVAIIDQSSGRTLWEKKGLTAKGEYAEQNEGNGRRQAILGDAVESGMVCINNVRTSWPDAPFGGMKESGFGSEDGPEGVEAHMVTKAIHVS